MRKLRLFNDKITIFPLLFFFIIGGCSHTEKNFIIPKKVHHIVICWLKDPENSQARKKLIEASKDLSEIPGVLSVKAGSVLPSQRKIADSSFDVAIIISFANSQAMNSYLTHPRHKKMVKEIVQPMTQKILVYDFVD